MSAPLPTPSAPSSNRPLPAAPRSRALAVAALSQRELVQLSLLRCPGTAETRRSS